MCLMKFLTKKDHYLLAGHASSWQQSIHGMDLSRKSFRGPLFAGIERKGVTSNKQQPHHLKPLAAEVRGMLPRRKGIQPWNTCRQTPHWRRGNSSGYVCIPKIPFTLSYQYLFLYIGCCEERCQASKGVGKLTLAKLSTGQLFREARKERTNKPLSFRKIHVSEKERGRYLHVHYFMSSIMQ